MNTSQEREIQNVVQEHIASLYIILWTPDIVDIYFIVERVIVTTFKFCSTFG